jgi:hypothetical protein
VAWAEAGKGGASPWDERQGSRSISRPAPGAMGRGGLTFELWEADGGHRAAVVLHFMRKKPLFSHGYAPGGTRSVLRVSIRLPGHAAGLP